MDIFETATREKLRFNSTIGLLSVEQIWDLPLVAKGERPNLDAIAREVSRSLRELGEESFVELKPDPRKSTFELQLAILKHVIAAKLAIKAAAEKAAENAERKRKLLAALSSKEEAELVSMTKEQIEAEIAKLAS